MTAENQPLTGLVQSEIPSEQHSLVKGHSVECEFANNQEVVIKFGGSTLKGFFVSATGFKDTCKVKVSGREYTVGLADVQDKATYDLVKKVTAVKNEVVAYAGLIAAWSLGMRDEKELSQATGIQQRFIVKQVAKLQKLGLIEKSEISSI